MEVYTIQAGLEAIGKEIKNGVYEDYFEAKTLFGNLDDQKKTMLAQAEIDVLEKARKSELTLTQTDIARFALDKDSYKDHLKGLSEARKQMNQCLAKVKSVESRMEIYRSLNKHLEYTNAPGAN